jgi:hypothetical protein
MKKIPCLFQRDFASKKPVLLKEVTPGCEWVLAGEGVATRKRDGTACAVINWQLYKRYDVKKGKLAPSGAIPCDPEADPVTGHWPHWAPVGEEPENKWHREAWARVVGRVLDGTYELCGPKIQGNPEKLENHVLLRHDSTIIDDCPRTWEGLQAFLEAFPGEGIVFHYPDGRMCKIRRDDFGFQWPILEAT